MKNKVVTKSSEETQKIGFDFAEKIKPADVLCLYGELGSGKTTFLQGFAKGLGLKTRIISPTFVIMRKHNLKIQNAKVKNTTQNLKVFYHIDLYRIETVVDLKGVGIDEILGDKHGVVAIEWAEKLGELLPEKRIDLQFAYTTNTERKIVVNKHE